MLEDWSRAIRPANFGKMQVTRGSIEVGVERTELLV